MRLDELLRLIANQGPIGLIAAVFGALWWVEKRAHERLQRDYFDHLQDDISAVRELRA